MTKKTKHYIPHKEKGLWGRNPLIGYPACSCFRDHNRSPLKAFKDESARNRGDTTCGNCKRTKIFRKIK